MYSYDPANSEEMHKKAVDRLSVERQFGKSSYDEKSDNNSQYSQVGEITGNRQNGNDMDRGMPMRAQYSIKKSSYDENKYIDFNLLSQKSENKAKSKKIQYNESNNYCSFADVNASATTLTTQIDPLYIVNNSIDKLGNSLNEYFQSVLPNKNYLVNTIGLYTLFGSLYLASENVTQNEVGKFFNYPQKDMLHKILNKIFATLDNDTEIINIKNFMIVDKKIPYNPGFVEVIKPFCIFSQVNIDDPVKESHKLNYIIDNILQSKMRNTTVASNLDKLQLMFMTVATIHPIWTFSFEKVVKSNFSGATQDRQGDFLLSFSRSYLYCEDNDNQMIEFKCGRRGEIGFGIILPKKSQKMVTNENIRMYITHAKQTIIDEIKIPVFSQNLKLRYNNTLKKLGLNSVFLQVFAEDLFPQKVQLHDVIQNVKIIVDNSSFGSKENNRGERSMIRFVANKPFTYYVRLAPTDTIILNGCYT